MSDQAKVRPTRPNTRVRHRGPGSLPSERYDLIAAAQAEGESRSYSSNARHVLLTLALGADARSAVAVVKVDSESSQSRSLTMLTGLSATTIRKALRELEDGGSIAVSTYTRPNGRQGSNQYTLAFARPALPERLTDTDSASPSPPVGLVEGGSQKIPSGTQAPRVAMGDKPSARRTPVLNRVQKSSSSEKVNNVVPWLVTPGPLDELFKRLGGVRGTGRVGAIKAYQEHPDGVLRCGQKALRKAKDNPAGFFVRLITDGDHLVTETETNGSKDGSYPRVSDQLQDPDRGSYLDDCWGCRKQFVASELAHDGLCSSCGDGEVKATG